MNNFDNLLNEQREEIAIIGMAGRFPGAQNIDEFWQNLKAGVESIRPFTIEELKASGVEDPMISDPSFVNAGAVLDGADTFDAPFFGFTPREAEIMDPQHRIFLECAWEAIESAGYDPETYDGLIGVFGGVAPNTYYQNNLITRPDLLKMMGDYAVMLASAKDYAVTRVSYKLNLKGPSVSVNTACSTSGVAIHLACQSLLYGDCDMALAGGARVKVPLKAGYLYQEGGIPSPDGHCRAFDEQARGTVVASGVGMIVLKRLSDALGDGDTIYGLIKGTAINNDGHQKVGFTAPSIEGQALVIEEALAMAGINPDTIGYVEAHGTGTTLGDPIEIAALTKAFRKQTHRRNFCAIGSVKTNIGHLDAAAGVVGVIKTALSLKNRLIPPSLNFKKPNPQIDFSNSPFYVNTELSEWPTNTTRRRAGVSSFGLGGANAHIVLEEAPEIDPSGSGRSQQLLLLSARSDKALQQMTENLRYCLKQHPDLNIADVAYTLQIGRRAFNHRRMVICRNLNEAVINLAKLEPRQTKPSIQESNERDIIFMFTGQGAQYVNMGRGLYDTEPVFKEQIDRCSQILQPYLCNDLREILYPEKSGIEQAEQLMQKTLFTQSALFTVEYALASLWIEWGLYPQAMVGHSIGEYVAACLSGVFTLRDALELVAARGQLMQQQPEGSMLAVGLPEHEIDSFLGNPLSLAAVNGPSLCVVSGEKKPIIELENRLSARGATCRLLHTSHAFHSKMMDPVVNDFTEKVKQITLQPPQIPFLSNVTGTWIRPKEATDPNYWARHLRQTVRFSNCIDTLLDKSNRVFLEIGPGQTLCTLVRQHLKPHADAAVLSSIRHPREKRCDQNFILNTVGSLWLNGTSLDWVKFYAHQKRQRIPLPTYPFERQRYWVERGKDQSVAPSLALKTFGHTECRLPHEGDSPLQIKRKVNDETPKNQKHQQIIGIWQELLGVEQIGINDNFFELGGSSLTAVNLFSRIADMFGTQLAPATIFQAPSIDQIVKILDQNLSLVAPSSLVKIQAGGTNPPFICLPGNLGNVFIDLSPLSRHLGSDQPVYGLQDSIDHPTKVEALAAHYIEDIRKVQAEPPYFLGGICSGGVVAFEMAQQLSRQGQTVALLSLVEPASLPLAGARSYYDLITEIWIRFVRRFANTSSNTSKLGYFGIMMFFRLRLKLIGNLWAMKRYRPQMFDGRIELFLTKESLSQSPRLGWADLASDGASVHEIPGTHRAITGDNMKIEDAHMQALAKKLKACINKAIHFNAAKN